MWGCFFWGAQSPCCWDSVSYVHGDVHQFKYMFGLGCEIEERQSILMR